MVATSLRSFDTSVVLEPFESYRQSDELGNPDSLGTLLGISVKGCRPSCISEVVSNHKPQRSYGMEEPSSSDGSGRSDPESRLKYMPASADPTVHRPHST